MTNLNQEVEWAIEKKVKAAEEAEAEADKILSKGIKMRRDILRVFRDLLDGLYSVLEEYEDDPEWYGEDEDVIDVDMEEEDDDEIEIADDIDTLVERDHEIPPPGCSIVGIRRQCGICNEWKDCVYAGEGNKMMYKYCADCRDKYKKQHSNKKEEEEEKVVDIIYCSTCGKKKPADAFGYKSEGQLYKSCSECRNKKKRRYEEVKKSSNSGSSGGEDKKNRKLADSVGSEAGGSDKEQVSTVGCSTSSTTGVAPLDISNVQCVIN